MKTPAASTKQAVEICDYDPLLPKHFEAERKQLLRSLGKKFAVHHIGSSAVPGLGGKNVVDLLVLAPNKHAALGNVAKINELGYVEKKVGSQNQLFFIRKKKVGAKTIEMHVRLTWRTHDGYLRYLLFRDYLRANPEEAANYIKLKKQWAATALDRQEYTESKAQYVKEIVGRAPAVRKR